MALTDPLKCEKCGHLEHDKDWLESCPACGSDKILYPVPSDEELIDRLIIPEGLPHYEEPLQDGKETRDGKGNLLLPGDTIFLYGRIYAKIFKVIMPQGWLIVRILVDEFPGHGCYLVSEIQYQISAALVFAQFPRVESPLVVKRVCLDESGWRRLWLRQAWDWFYRKWTGS